jgi:hypothetical protein
MKYGLTQNGIRKNIFKSELSRLVNFAVLSEGNKIDVLEKFEELCYSLILTFYELA